MQFRLRLKRKSCCNCAKGKKKKKKEEGAGVWNLQRSGPARFAALKSLARGPLSRLAPPFFARNGGDYLAEVVEAKNGGAKRDRTADLLHAMQALSQLSYGPITVPGPSGERAGVKSY